MDEGRGALAIELPDAAYQGTHALQARTHEGGLIRVEHLVLREQQNRHHVPADILWPQAAPVIGADADECGYRLTAILTLAALLDIDLCIGPTRHAANPRIGVCAARQQCGYSGRPCSGPTRRIQVDRQSASICSIGQCVAAAVLTCQG